MAHAGPARRLRILLYAQHLSGVGHYVRTLEIARALGACHDVRLIEGGRPVPRSRPPGVAFVPVPRIARGPRGLVSLDGDLDTAEVLNRRRAQLRALAEDLCPDVVVVEHYPFSKWELEGEILGMIEAARRVRSDVRVVCSVRDVLPQTRHEDCPADVYAAKCHRPAARLVRRPDGPRRPFAHTPRRPLPARGGIRLPVTYTGIVSETLAPRTDAEQSVPG